jgi:DNA-binding CsgD family transcriptional regulator
LVWRFIHRDGIKSVSAAPRRFASVSGRLSRVLPSVHIPTIAICGDEDAEVSTVAHPDSRPAMKAGTVDFVEKPIGDGELLTIIERARVHPPGSPEDSKWRAKAARRMTGLTIRQREILALVVASHPNKEIAAHLGIHQRTIESHRATVMKRRERSRSLIWSDCLLMDHSTLRESCIPSDAKADSNPRLNLANNEMAHPTRFERVASTFGGQRSIWVMECKRGDLRAVSTGLTTKALIVPPEHAGTAPRTR